MYEKLNEALAFAAEAHKGQLRKIVGTPYILHPMEVAAILSTLSGNEELLIAGLLHDTVEDCGVRPEEIAERFGLRVSALVQCETEDKLSDRPPEETWMERKADSLLILQHTQDLDVKRLWLADKLSNMRSFYREYRLHGDLLWNAMHQHDPKKHAWYYRTIARSLPELEGSAAYEEYTDLVRKVFGEEE